MIQYLNLAIGAPNRLANLRIRKPAGDWRVTRAATMQHVGAPLSQGFNSESGKPVPVWYCHGGPQFRDEKDAHKIDDVRMNHTGYYKDVDGNSLIVGIVGHLTRGRFIAGYRDDECGERVYFNAVYDCERTAAYAADRAAELIAEKERDYDERRMNAIELTDKIEHESRNVARMFKLRNTTGFDSASDYRDLEWAIKSLRKDKANMASNYADIEL